MCQQWVKASIGTNIIPSLYVPGKLRTLKLYPTFSPLWCSTHVVLQKPNQQHIVIIPLLLSTDHILYCQHSNWQEIEIVHNYQLDRFVLEGLWIYMLPPKPSATHIIPQKNLEKLNVFLSATKKKG